MGMSVGKAWSRTAWIALALALAPVVPLSFITPPSAFALDNPHIPANAVGCDNCHANPAALDFNNQGDQTNGVCGQCHNPSLTAQNVKPHATPDYGGTIIQCTECHNPHAQNQSRVYKAASYVHTGALSATLNAVQLTTLQLSAPLPAPPAGTASWLGFLIMPDKRYAAYIYRIAAYDPGTNTITIDTGKNGTELINTSMIKPGAGYAIVYGKLVKDYVLGRAVRFFRPEGANSFADGDTTIDGVCQVCHMRTASFNNSGQLESGAHPSGQAGKKCTVCHSHDASSGGFMPECNSCHGYPPIVNTLGGPDGLANNEGGTGSTTPGAHQKHAVSLGYGCDTCHTGGMPASPIYDKKIQIGFNLFDGVYQSGTYNGRNNLANGYTYSAGNAGTTINPNGQMSCTNIYCHSIVQTATGGTLTLNTSDYKTPIWGGAPTTCTSCHGYPSNSGAHLKHAGTDSSQTQYSFPCDYCHSSYVPPGVSTHVNGSIDVAIKSSLSGSYNGDTTPGTGFSNCSNTYCHSDGTGGTKNIATCAPLTPPDLRPVATNISPTWNSSGPLACNACHGGANVNGRPAEGGSYQKAGLHGFHAQYGVSQCDWCHFDTVDSNNQIKNPLKHANGYYDVVPNTSVVFGGTTTIGFTYQYRQSGGRCYNNNCHPLLTHTWGWPNVVNINPTASSTALRTNLTVTYTVTASDPDYNYCDHSGNGTIYVYWGDGGNGDTQSVPLTDVPTDFVFTHTYTSCNSYNIQATVTDNAGGTAQTYSTVDTRYSVYGTVTHGIPATGLAGATMYLQYQLPSGSWTTQKSTTTASDGSYSFTLNCPGTYRVLPIMSGETFSPTISPNFTLGPDATGVNFTATP